MERKLTKEEFDALVGYLEGSCMTIDEALNTLFGIDFTELSLETLEALDGEIFCCENCGWWCNVDEMSEEDIVCNNCWEESNG